MKQKYKLVIQQVGYFIALAHVITIYVIWFRAWFNDGTIRVIINESGEALWELFLLVGTLPVLILGFIFTLVELLRLPKKKRKKV